jgi:serine phosphatase RsbU (regulator of sigma subunit)
MAGRDLADGRPPTENDVIHLLLIEDDDGDAVLFEELLLDATETMNVQRAESLREAAPLLAGVECVVLDLNLPDAHGLDALRSVLERVPRCAVVVLTGLDDEHLGVEAVAAGAQDYLAKGRIDGFVLGRVIRYAVQRRRAEDVARQLDEINLRAEENARIERGLLPRPLLTDASITAVTRYRPGGGWRRLLGGDFFDLVQSTDDWVHALVGDVCGHGPDEAALGVYLRVAWRTMVLAGRPIEEILATLHRLFEHERHRSRLFATLCTVSIAPDRRRGRLYLLGHPGPLLLTDEGIAELHAPVNLPIGLGGGDPIGHEVELGAGWSLLLYTDGLVEGRVGGGTERLEVDGLIGLLTARLAETGTRGIDESLLDDVLSRVRELHGGDLDDDVAVLALSHATPSHDQEASR